MLNLLIVRPVVVDVVLLVVGCLKLVSRLIVAAVVLATSGCLQMEVGYQGYKSYLSSQEKTARTIPSELIEKIQSSYSMPIEDVRIYTNIDTVSGNVVTMGNKIYFPRRMLMNQAGHVRRLLHELRHVEQYARDGDFFFQKYISAGATETFSQIGEGLGRGSVDTHAHFSYEAEAKSAETDVFPKVKPLCDDRICVGLK